MSSDKPMQVTMNHTNLDYLKLMADGDRDMEQTMLEMLLSELPEEFAKMKSLYQEQNWEELSKVSHKMKSTLAFIGNEDVTAANKQIEQLAKSEVGLEIIESLMATFENRLPDILAELKQIFKTY